MKKVNLLPWFDTDKTTVVTLGELVADQRIGVTKRQYWNRQANPWKIFKENIG